MATFTKRGNRWKAQIRRTGYPSLTKTFAFKAEAEAWAREKERAIDRAELPINHRDLKGTTVGDLLSRYRDTITPTKRAKETEGYMIKTMLAHELALVPLSKLSPASIARYRDDRLKAVTPSTILRELVLLSHLFNLAIREWDIPLSANPVSQITKPAPNKARDRRLEMGELESLMEGLAQCRNPLKRALRRAEARHRREMTTLQVECFEVYQARVAADRAAWLSYLALDAEGLGDATAH